RTREVIVEDRPHGLELPDPVREPVVVAQIRLHERGDDRSLASRLARELATAERAVERWRQDERREAPGGNGRRTESRATDPDRGRAVVREEQHEREPRDAGDVRGLSHPRRRVQADTERVAEDLGEEP